MTVDTTRIPPPGYLFMRDGLSRCLTFYREGRLQAQTQPESGACFYRHPADGSPCAVGAMIPDAQMDDILKEGPGYNKFPVSVLSAPGHPLWGISQEVVRDLQSLQNAHDTWANKPYKEPEFEGVLMGLCEKYGVPT